MLLIPSVRRMQRRSLVEDFVNPHTLLIVTTFIGVGGNLRSFTYGLRNTFRRGSNRIQVTPMISYVYLYRHSTVKA